MRELHQDVTALAEQRGYNVDQERGEDGQRLLFLITFYSSFYHSFNYIN